jgi:hypothetical protein
MFIKFHKFKELVTQLPLAPDQSAISTIKQIKQDQRYHSVWLEEGENLLTQPKDNLLEEEALELE